MKAVGVCCLFAALFITRPDSLAAHPGDHSHADAHSPHSLRTWTIADDGLQLRGTFLAANQGRVQIQHDFGAVTTFAIDQLAAEDRAWVERRQAEIERLNAAAVRQVAFQAAAAAPPAPDIAASFQPFVEKQQVKVRWDDRFLFVESHGVPDHRMMVGITAWQQQVPLPQSYTGDNAWRIPLHPVPAKQPLSAKTGFFRGAIALAVNGVPIFNPIKNDGRTDTFLAGELDEFGGHCGRADDYHYHLPPVHLEKIVGAGQPIAHALDGYPILGEQKPSDPDFAPLDPWNGHKDAAGRYHYHATKTYPYLNGGFFGEVTERDGQVDPQPRAYSPRAALPPLRGAKITGFRRSEDGRETVVEYEVRGEKRSVSYSLTDREVAFTYDDGAAGVERQTYSLSNSQPRGQPKPDRPPGKGGKPNRREPPRKDDPSKTPSAVADPVTSPPNIVFILLDDMGWRDVGFAGNKFVETPHIDRLAAEGVQFSQAYASAPNCAPTRACLLSGQYTPRHGVYTVIDPRHDPGQPTHKVLAADSRESLAGEVVTIAEVLKSRGYATGCFGMWNLGRGNSGPSVATNQGFDIYKKPQDLGFDKDAYFDAAGRELTDVLTDEGLRFVEQHRTEPFFLYLPTHAIHAPFEAKPELLEKYRGKAAALPADAAVDADPLYAAMIENVDANVGRILRKLAELQLADKTLIVFTSDNGGTPRHVAPLNGSKGALYEGGIRVPCAVWWSGIRNPGRVSPEPILSMDFFPTLAELAGAKLPAGQAIDGVSLLPILQATGPLGREAIFWHFPCYVGRSEPSSAVRQGDWKLIENFADQTFELFDLQRDPGETRNLASSEPERARELIAALQQWQQQLAAPRPTTANPNFDPAAVRGRRKPS